ncbi:MAG TPA: malto-oligosyltrehalose trehalohydrolase [Candidatus Acidoferrales bacterium]|nr:malto-oligosyltrehalose trehalohydrolase [Candidatus Acidoferrales bacterium]
MRREPIRETAGTDMELGPTYLGDHRCHFLVWAPRAKEMDVHILPSRTAGDPQPRRRAIRMEPLDRGYYRAIAEDVEPGDRYVYRLDGQKERPDPASRYQPEGVHGPSQVEGPAPSAWDEPTWVGLPLEQYLFYEIHVGTFTPEGTFDAILPRLAELARLGITAMELMPIAQFPGHRNWGYDGVFPFAIQNSYGGPEGLRRLVSACHRHGMAVVLDVVYNHLGPEGNSLADFGPYFTDHYRTSWGPAVNYDGPQSDEVRRYFINNALYWIREFHVDALRLDAIHAIVDLSAQPFLEELGRRVHEEAEQRDRQVFVIAESDLNDPRVLRPPELGGLGLDAQWNDDFHHALHTLLTKEQNGYYRDFGTVGQMAKAFSEGFVISGEYSGYRQRRHGHPSRQIPAHQFVVFAQNHDQVGNRALGDRLSQLVSFEALKLAAGVLLLSPFLPLLFMGEEYSEIAPFQYFVSHSDPSLIEAVRKGRQQEFMASGWSGEVSDPQAETTFLRSKLRWESRHEAHHRVLLDFYRELIGLRRALPALAHLSKKSMEVAVDEKKQVLSLDRWSGANRIFASFHFGDTPVSLTLPVPPGEWRKRLDPDDERWLGRGSLIPEAICSMGKVPFTMNPASFALFVRERAPSNE